jgi:hypothetical protein
MPTIRYHSDALADDFVLFCDDVRRIDAWRKLFADGLAISAMTIKPSDSSLRGTIEASRDILIGRRATPPNSRLWMFLTSPSWQEDTRLTNYWGIWKRLGRNGVTWPEAFRGPEIAVRAPHGVRYVTAGLVGDAEFSKAVTILFQNLVASFLVISADNLLSKSSILTLFDSSFSVVTDGNYETNLNWGRLIHARALQGDVIAKRASLFDEFAWSLDLFARPDILDVSASRSV